MPLSQKALFRILVFLPLVLTSPLLGGEASRFHNFAQVADGGDYQTTFLFLNPSHEEVEIALEFRRDDGTPWELSIDGISASQFQWTLAPQRMVSVQTDRAASSVITGWASLTADSEVGAQAFFEVISGDKLISQAAVESTGPTRSAKLFVKESSTTQTGIALVNLSKAGKIKLDLELFNQEGERFAGEMELDALNHSAKFISEIMPEVQNVTGMLIISASGPFEAVTLQVTGSVLGTLPVVISAN